MAKKNKERPDRDAFGRKDLPWTSGDNQMEFQGIKPLRGASQRSVNIRTKGIAAISLAIAAFFTVSSFTAISSNVKVSRLEAAVEENYNPAFKTRYASLGESIITSYFAHQTPTVNLLSGVQWSTNVTGDESSANASSVGSTSDSSPVDVKGLSLVSAYQTNFSGGEIPKEDKELFKNPKNEVLRYSGTIDGRQYEFGIYLIIPDIDNTAQLPYLVSAPTILPMDKLVTADVEGSKPNDPEMFSETDLNDGTLDAINRWASAYAQDDGDTIKSLTGDGRVEATYSGVGGFTLEGTPEVVWAYQFEDPESKEQRIVARVNFMMSQEVSAQSSSNDISGSSSSSRFAPVQSMDMLFGGFSDSEGVAKILAWDTGGAWQTLAPRMNAILPVVTGKKDDSTSDIVNAPTTSTQSFDQPTNGENPTPIVPGAPTFSTDTSRAPSDFDEDEGGSEESSSSSKPSKKKSSKKSGSKSKSSSTSKKRSADGSRG